MQHWSFGVNALFVLSFILNIFYFEPHCFPTLSRFCSVVVCYQFDFNCCSSKTWTSLRIYDCCSSKTWTSLRIYVSQSLTCGAVFSLIPFYLLSSSSIRLSLADHLTSALVLLLHRVVDLCFYYYPNKFISNSRMVSRGHHFGLC